MKSVEALITAAHVLRPRSTSQGEEKVKESETHLTGTNTILHIIPYFVMSLAYFWAFHQPDQSATKEQSRLSFYAVSLNMSLSDSICSQLLEISPAFGPDWLNIKTCGIFISSFFYLKWYMLLVYHEIFSLDLHPLKSFGTCAITNCSICKRSKCGSKATQLSISIKQPSLTCLLSHQ